MISTDMHFNVKTCLYSLDYYIIAESPCFSKAKYAV